MTSTLHERATGDFAYKATHTPEDSGHMPLEGQDPATDNPRAALDEALRVNKSTANYGNVDLDPRMYTIIQLNKLATSADRFSAVASMPDCDDETRVEAEEMSNALNTRFDSAVSEIHRFKLLLMPQTGMFIQKEASIDVKDYKNSKAISAALLTEQLPDPEQVYLGRDADGNYKRDEDMIREAMAPIDTDLIIKITEQMGAYPKAHTMESLRDRGDAFVELLKGLNDTQLTVNMHGADKLPVANAFTRLLAAQSLHDLAMLGKFNTEENRDLAIKSAVTDLWDAKKALESTAAKNDVTAGILEVVDEFLVKYSKEIGVDPTVDPADRAFEITDEQIDRLITDLGAAAHSASSLHH